MTRQRLRLPAVALLAALAAGQAVAQAQPAPAATPRAAAAALPGAAPAAPPGADAASVADRIARMRGMPPAANAAAAGTQRRELDAAWRFFGDHRDDAVPALRHALQAELRSPRPNPLLLLDAAYFLRLYGDASDHPLTLQALLAIDPGAAVDGAQLFRLAHAVAADGEQRQLAWLDQAFLRQKITVPVPQHGAIIDESGACVLLYGRFGLHGERRLAQQLGDPAVAQRALDVLHLVGTPDSVPAVAAQLHNPDQEIFTRAVNVLLRSGGPQGREALLALQPKSLGDKAREFFDPMREQIARPPAPPSGQGAIPDGEVRRQLDQLEANLGRYEGIDPATILQSRLPRQELLERLQRIRARTLARATLEALSDLETTSAVLNAARYRTD